METIKRSSLFFFSNFFKKRKRKIIEINELKTLTNLIEIRLNLYDKSKFDNSLVTKNCKGAYEEFSEIANGVNKNFIITFSSGTTSQPKPILYTQKIKYLRFLQIKKIFNIKSNDTIFSVSSIDHSLGQRLLFLE